LLVYFAQLPVLFAGLTLGLTGSGIAALGAIVMIGLMVSMAAALGYGLLHALPALFTLRQALLRRTDQGRTEWFPVGLLLTQLTVLAGLGVLVAFVLLGFGVVCPASSRSTSAGLSEVGQPRNAPSPNRAFGGSDTRFAASSSLPGDDQLMLAQALAVRAGWARHRRRSSSNGATGLAVAGHRSRSWRWPAASSAISAGRC
jgi:hypothetical protein